MPLQNKSTKFDIVIVVAMFLIITVFTRSTAAGQWNSTDSLYSTAGVNITSEPSSELSAALTNPVSLSANANTEEKEATFRSPIPTSTSSKAGSLNSGRPITRPTGANKEPGREVSSEDSQSDLSQKVWDCLTSHSRLVVHIGYYTRLEFDPRKTALSISNTPLSCNLSIVTAADKWPEISYRRQRGSPDSCSEQNYIAVRYSGQTFMYTDCARSIFEKLISTTSAIDVELVAGEPQVAFNMTIVFRAWARALETGHITENMGFIQTPNFGFESTYPPTMDSWVKISVPQNHVALLNYVRMQVVDCYKFNGDSVSLYANGKSPLYKLWEKCDTPEPLPEVYNATVLYLRFISNRVNNDFGFKLLYSLHKESYRPRRVPGGMWNCSVPEWPEFEPHFRCNLKKECERGEDEEICFYTGRCGKGYLTLGSRCYIYIFEETPMSWAYSNFDCVQRGGYLASLNTPEEWERVVHALEARVHVRGVVVGLAMTSKTFPFMYSDSLIWSDETIAYYAEAKTISRPTCGMLDKRYALDVTKTCHDRLKLDRLCELETPSGANMDADKGAHAKTTPNNLPPRPQNSSFTARVVNCPAGHVTHTFLACDEQSVCWLSRNGHSENEAWGFPSSVSCPVDMTTLPAMFACSSGLQHVPYTMVCDHRRHCLDDSDESFCVFPPCSRDTFPCAASAQCVPVSAMCNGQIDCTDGSDEGTCRDIRVHKYHAIPPPAVVQLRHSVSQFGKYEPAFTITSIPEQIIDNSPCPETHFQCADNGYCLPVFVRCNSIKDCPGSEDEAGCDDSGTSCPGFYRCRSSRVCLHPSHVCDGVHQCPQHDDELLCRLICPTGCTCNGLAFTCRQNFRVELHSEIRFLDASGSGLTPENITTNTLLIHLSLSACGLDDLQGLDFPSLRSLDLSLNGIDRISTDDLDKMINLQYLILSKNPIHFLFSSTNKQIALPAIRKLDLSGIKLQELHTKSLSFFPGLHTLNLSHCGIDTVTGESLVKSNNLLRVLDTVGCPMTHFPRDLFTGMDQLQKVRADNYKLCCPDTLPSGFKQDNCDATFNEVSSCESLLRSDLYRVVLYVFCGLALLGNLGCFLLRCFRFKTITSGFGVFVTHLTVADFLMGVYLGVIGVADRLYRGSYLWKDILWRHSAACSLAGYLSLLSSEVSACIICLITLDRFLVLRFPFSSLHFKARSAHGTCAVVWITGVLLAAVPLTPLTSHWLFYSHTGICIPLPITRKYFAGHLYAFGILIIFNFVLFFFIAVGQAAIYVSIKANSMSGADSSKNSNDLRIARRLITVALSDFLCWFPIGLVGLLASRGVPISSEVNVGMAILVLPLNSALNPFLYTINVILERRRRSRDDEIVKQLMARMSEEDEK